MRPLHSPLLRIAVLAAVLGATGWFAGHRVVGDTSSVDAATVSAHAPALAVALVMFSIATLLLGAAWIVVIDDVSGRTGPRVSLVIAFVYAWLVRYVPGTVPFFAVRYFTWTR